MSIQPENIKPNSINNPELEKHFYVLANIFRTIGHNYSEIRILAISIIFIKRLIDIEYFNQEQIYSVYNANKNRRIHDFYGFRDALQQLFRLIGSCNANLHQVLSNVNLTLDLSNDNQVALNSLIQTLVKTTYDINRFSETDFGKAFNLLIEVTKDPKGSEYLTPGIIKKIMVELLDIQQPCTVYDPAVGVGGFFIQVQDYLNEQGLDDSGIDFTGQERNQQIFALFVMNMYMNGFYDNKALLGDTIMEPQNVAGDSLIKYDRIIADPPFGMSTFGYEETYRMDRYQRFLDGIPGKNSSFAFVQHILASLKNTGKAIVLLNQSILFSKGSDFEIRKSIIEKDLFETIIKLPSGILEFTSNEPAIVVFNKLKPVDKKNKVQMVDLSKQFNKDEIVGVNVNKLVNEFRMPQNGNKFTSVVELKQIAENNYNLNVELYNKDYSRIQDLLEQRQGVRLEEIAEVVRGTRPATSNSVLPLLSGYVLTTKDLSREITSKYLETNLVKEENVRGREIKKRCILISLIGNALKPTIYDPLRVSNPSIHFIIGNNIIALYPKEEIIRLEYLYYQLYSTEIQKQISVLRKGVIPNFSMTQLRELVIPIPSFGDTENSLKEQELFINQQTQSLYELEELRFKDKVKELDLKKASIESETTTIRTLAHNILPFVTDSSLALESLKTYLKNNNLFNEFVTPDHQIKIDPELKDHFPNQNNRQTVKQVIERIEGYLEHTQNVIVKTRDIITETIKEEDFEICNLYGILLDFINQNKIEYQGLFDIKLKSPDLVSAKISKVHFIEILNNIIRNAKAHAFNYDKDDAKRFVEFEIKASYETEQIVITYRNNGKTMELSEDEFFQALKKGKQSTGIGLGGFYIKTIMQQMKGDVKLIPKKKGMELKMFLPTLKGIGGGGGL